jgi:hypothetical protein
VPLLEELPGDVQLLKEIIAALHQREDAFKVQIRTLENELIRFRKEFYGRKSEKVDLDDVRQSRLFNEIEHSAIDQPVLYNGHDDKEEVDSYTRQKKGRKP